MPLQLKIDSNSGADMPYDPISIENAARMLEATVEGAFSICDGHNVPVILGPGSDGGYRIYVSREAVVSLIALRDCVGVA